MPKLRQAGAVAVDNALELSDLMAGLVDVALVGVLTLVQLDDQGWPVAMMLGVVAVPFGLVLRSRLKERLGGRSEIAAPTARASLPWIVALGTVLLGNGTVGSYTLNHLTT